MDRMADSGSVGWAFESPRDHKEALKGAFPVRKKNEVTRQYGVDVKNLPADRQVSRHKVIKICHCLDL